MPRKIIAISRGSASDRRAFTLLELLVVMAIVAIMLGLSVASIQALRDSGNITGAAYNLAGALENARAYALANNTYVWVGFYEESSGAPGVNSSHIQGPPYTSPNIGRLVVAVVGSNDGSSTLTTYNLVPLQPLTFLPNVHITNLNTSLAPAATNLSLPNNLSGRPLADSFLDSENANTATLIPTGTEVFLVNNYQFYKAIRFDPRGGAEMDTPTKTLQHLIEVGLVPTHGGKADTASKNLVAIQITGAGGNVRIYRP